jgi:hypothetical protein
MKHKVVYLSLIVFVIIIIITIFLGPKIKKDIFVSNQAEVSQKKTDKLQHMFPEQAQQFFELPATNVSGITIVKPSQNEESASELERKRARSRKARELVDRYTQSQTSQDKDAGTGSQPDSGITKINKYPSEIKSSEMNEQGIVIY